MGGSPLHVPLLRWYDGARRELPWRAPDRTPWGVLVSEVMLQQTQVARVLPVWLAWMRRWPTPASLAAEPAGEAVRAWGRLGYPRRALRLHRAATQITDQHGGQVPDDHDALLALEGVGSYTAAAVASFAFGRRHAVLDTNVRRVLARAVGGDPLPTAGLTRADVVRAEALVPGDAPTAARWAVAVMELGALVCTARSPSCGACPVADQCAWLAAGAAAYDGPQRRGQAWHGTDRQVRGRLLTVVRDAYQPVGLDELVAAAPDDSLRDPHQRDRALASLVKDGLLQPVGERYALPT